MTIKSFVIKLKLRMLLAPEKLRQDTVCYYEEIIRDKMEAGLPEHQVVASVGSIEQIARSAAANVADERKKYSRPSWLRWLAVATAIVWAPAIFGLLAAAVGLAVSYIAVTFSLGLAGVAVMLYSVANVFFGINISASALEILNSVGMLAAAGSLLCLISIFMFKGLQLAVRQARRFFAPPVRSKGGETA